MLKIYTKSYTSTEKKLVMKIRKMNAYTNTNRADMGMFLIEESISSTNTQRKRIISIKCSTYKDTLKFSAYDIIPDLDKIGVYFVDTTDYVEMYIGARAYSNISVTLLTCDNQAIYEFIPYSNVEMAEDASYTIPNERGSIENVNYTLGENMSLTSASMTVNKLFYNHNTKTVDGELCIKPNATGNQIILTCDGLVQSANANEALVYMAFAWIASDGTTADNYEVFPITWDRTNNKLTGKVPENCIRIILPIHTYLAEGLIN